MVVDNRSYLDIRGVVGDKSGFDLHLANEMLMLLGIDKNIVVAKEFFDLVQNR